MLFLPPLSLYLHIPWCMKKCPYCDFHAIALQREVSLKEYVKHLLMDLEHDIQLIASRTVNTLFIGGGTPSLLSASVMKSLLDGIRQRVSLAPNAEITMEANPGTVEADRFMSYQKAGINRISIGVQSFNQEQLFRLGRIHRPEDARYAARLAISLGLRNFNLDLMHGLPEQSLSGALNDIAQAIALKPPHVSWYQLTIEPNTLFASKPPILPNSDTLWDIYQNCNQVLTSAGYQQYEISAYAQPGFQCRHNLNYWRFGDYLGIGCAAHGKLSLPDGRVMRTIKTRSPYSYMQGNYLAKHYEVLPADLTLEYFMNRFRLMEACPRIEFTTFTGVSETTVRSALDQALTGNYITENITHWQITDKGRLFLNSLLELFI
ncbi:radical SAM family heme chaperone HemW [Candidatus Steffania adelgidicola]|uniref:radical SAM family heme chaperone HemW n=1 Tax=Candidatus Steffania adelgidicola TaxID=1076626 RepID=UPI001D03117D|nr:radical SAM family heme chaperone HemW [Candidatus Steffania adelgidicola]UDG79887.1 Oxygen-independent coproporphyrinogen-III oxidase-like protein [Candidatus Steffania adelgidicola]